jgi:plasmid maintenance system killer protein
MIRSFECQWVEDLHHGIKSTLARDIPIELHAKIHRIFDHLNTATSLEQIAIPGIGNLSRFMGGAWGIRLAEWHIIFKWFEGDIYNLNIVRA